MKGHIRQSERSGKKATTAHSTARNFHCIIHLYYCSLFFIYLVSRELGSEQSELELLELGVRDEGGAVVVLGVSDSGVVGLGRQLGLAGLDELDVSTDGETLESNGGRRGDRVVAVGVGGEGSGGGEVVASVVDCEGVEHAELGLAREVLT